jgi:hypothetical protein
MKARDGSNPPVPAQTVVETPDFFLKERSGFHNLVRTAVVLKIAAYSFLGSARDDFKKR